MRPIRMVDLQQQYQKISSEIKEALSTIMENSTFIGGKPVDDFTNSFAKFHNAKHAIPCANGTDALQIAMMGLGLQPGDEVIAPSFTYVATTEVIALLHLQPVFVDVDPKTFCIYPEAIRKAITPKTKAIVPVHLYGHAAPMDEILEIARENNLFVIEDNAQATGCTYFSKDGIAHRTGTMGIVGCTSFFPSKNLGCYGDGGAMVTNDDSLADRLKMIANHGQKKRYYHELIGCNSRLDAMQAAILSIKLPLLDGYIESRRQAADYYDKGFSGNPKITTPYRAPYCKHVFHQYTLVLEDVDRNGLADYLAKQQIPSMIYYPVPAHRQQMFAAFGGSKFNLPVTDWLTERVISLPMHTELDHEQQDFIINHVLKYVNGNK
ncbi:MAG: DegT/DnrJ/EryC1/StrS family aminotransferase [Chitinophagaceae bacterium]|nr:DegT/DnrJ/EryC1/StrS family aminotransferase [Chitinophagaceae bacterium]